MELVSGRPELSFIVAHQLMGESSLSEEFSQFRNCTYVPLTNVGLSASRNVVLEKCITKYVLISDDDVDYPSDLTNKLDVVLREFSSYAAIIGKIRNDCGQYFKSYRTRRSHGYIDYFRVSSIEMVLNVDFLKSKNIRFDEQFGLGSTYPSGEELILLMDMRSNGALVTFVDTVLGIHPSVSTGSRLLTDPDVGMEKGPMIRRAFGFRRGMFYMALFLMRIALKKGMQHKRAFSLATVRSFFHFKP